VKSSKGPAARLKNELASESQHLVHELEVHRIELEMQNQELNRTREEVELGLERYTELFDFAPNGYATLDENQRIREVNHAGARIIGRPRSLLVGVPFAELIAPEDLDLFETLLVGAADREERGKAELRLCADPLPCIHVRMTAAKVESTGLLIAFEDITEEKMREDRLAQTELQLRQADRRKDDFIAMLSHELRNPLAPIRTGLHVLSRVDPNSQQAKKALSILERQATHLSRLIDDLLDVTRVTHGKGQLRCEELELSELLHATVDDHRLGFQAHGVHLEHDFPDQPLWVLADPSRLIQILTNLLGNAEKFTPRGGTVTVSLRKAQDFAELKVIDNGAGISAEVLPVLFEPFAQAPQTMDRSRGGLGLGLATVKGLVELHGGSVSMASGGLGKGTEVTIRIPILERTARLEFGPIPSSGQHRRILLIEDNEDAADVLGEALSLGGHEVQIAHDGKAGLQLARVFKPEIAICDIGLSGMDGYEVARAFRADRTLSDVYLVALSGYAQPEDVRRATDAGFNRHIAKPTTFVVLQQVLSRAPPRPQASH